MKAVASSIIFLLALAGCASTTTPSNDVMILNPELHAANADYAASMAAPRSPMTMASGATVSNCGEYLALGDGVDSEPSPNNRIPSLEYVTCDSLSVLRGALPVSAADINDSMGEALATRLDMRSFRSSMHQRTTDEAFTLQALTDHPLKIGPHAAELDSPVWYFKLEVVGVADIDASGKPDWLIWVVDQSLEGTYLAIEPLIIHDPVASGLLKASPMPR